MNLTGSDSDVEPVEIMQWLVDNMTAEVSDYLQWLISADNLLPEQLEALYKVKMFVNQACARVHNIAAIYGKGEVYKLRPVCYDAKQFMEAAVRQITEFLDDESVEIRLDGCDCGSVVFDMRRMSVILYNLVSNSVIHVRKNEKLIEISASMSGDSFVVSVRDNGRGISLEKRKKMFSAYENNFTPAKMTKDGLMKLSGMGLSVCRKLAREMGGDVEYAASSKGGTEFRVWIPQNRAGIVCEPSVFIPNTELMEKCLASARLYLKKIY